MYKPSKIIQAVDFYKTLGDKPIKQAIVEMSDAIGVSWRTAHMYYWRINTIFNVNSANPNTKYVQAVKIIMGMPLATTSEIQTALTEQISAAPETIAGYMRMVVPTIKYILGHKNYKVRSKEVFDNMKDTHPRSDIVAAFVKLGCRPVTAEGYYREFKRGYRNPKKTIADVSVSII